MKSIIIISLLITILSLNLSKNSLTLIKKYNPLQLEAYLPAFGEWKIGYGTTNSDYSITKTKIVPGLKINKKTAEKWLIDSLKKIYVPKINKYERIYKWKQNQFDALLSYVYDNNSLDILTNNGKKKKEDIAKSILMYSKIPINSHDDLIKANKRKDEYKLFVKG